MCSDRERNLYPVEHCNVVPKPLTLETCNTQPCYHPQVTPSMQDPRGHDNTQYGFTPYMPDHATVHRPDSVNRQTSTVYHPHGSLPAQHCSQSYYGCCPDGTTAAGGTGGLGCPQVSRWAPRPEQAFCTTTRYGCCRDGVTVSQRPNREDCLEYVPQAPLPAENSIQCRLTTYGCCFDRMFVATGPNGEGCPDPPYNVPRTTCSLPKAAGSCSGWTGRYFYDVTASKCSHFWYGGCHGNNNNFLTRAECQRTCPVAQVNQMSQPSSQSIQTIQLSQPSQPETGQDMSRVLTVQRGSSRGSTGGRQGTSAADHARRARVHVRRPAPYGVLHTQTAAR
eukprot:XP_014040717.1 PREDICTED: papilin-like [Salmo salar]